MVPKFVLGVLVFTRKNTRVATFSDTMPDISTEVAGAVLEYTYTCETFVCFCVKTTSRLAL